MSAWPRPDATVPICAVVRAVCLRHAESANVISGASGALPAAPLTPRGREQAVVAAQALLPQPIVRLYASTAVRARQSARVIADILKVEVRLMSELTEVGIGRLEGAIEPAVRARTAESLHAWVVQRDLNSRVADGEDGHQVVARISSAFEVIASAHPGETIAVIGHVASLTAGLSVLCGLGSRVWGAPLPHATPFLVTRTAQGWNCPVWPSPDS